MASYKFFVRLSMLTHNAQIYTFHQSTCIRLELILFPKKLKPLDNKHIMLGNAL